MFSILGERSLTYIMVILWVNSAFQRHQSVSLVKGRAFDMFRGVCMELSACLGTLVPSLLLEGKPQDGWELAHTLFS